MSEAIIKVEKLHPNGRAPTRGSYHALGYDLYACQSGEIGAHSSAKIDIGIAVELPIGCGAIIKDRSSLAKRRIYTHAGVIESDYRGEWSVLFENQSSLRFDIAPGDRIAQFILVMQLGVDVEVFTKLTDTERGSGSFGSTGK